MEDLTGSRDISAAAIKAYFQPLYNWLKNENQKASKNAGRNVVGWRGETIKWAKTSAKENILLDKFKHG